jgi:AcrR family transcriptional regulator
MELDDRPGQPLTWTAVQLWNGPVQTRLPVAERRAQLVDAALAVAVAEGIAAVTVRRVAEEAGVALGVVHYAFADKDELLAAMAGRIVDELADAGASALEVDDGDDLARALTTAVDGIWRSIEATAGAQLLTYEITAHALRNPALHDVAHRQYAVSQAAAERLLELAAEASGATWKRPVAELAAEALAYVDGITLRWLVDRDGAAARARLAAFAGYLAGQASARRRRRRAS